MNMIDEQVLRDAMAQVANEFEVSQDATNRILNEARVRKTSTKSWRAAALFARHGHNHVGMAVAAAVIAVGALSIPLLLSETGVNSNRTVVHGAIGPEKTVAGSGFNSSPGLLSPTTLSERTTQKGATVTSTGAAKSFSGTSTSNNASDLSPKIESTGSVSLAVGKGKINASLTKLGAFASKDGGYVFSTRAYTGSTSSTAFSTATLVLQVPQHDFATLVGQVQRIGHATAVNTSSANVTGQYVDLQARIGALEASRQQYLAIMKRATSISGILEVQAQLNALQSQIEQYQGQLNVLSHETTYATLTVLLIETGQHHVSHRESGLRKAWHDSVGGFVAGIEWLIRLAGPVLFTLLLLGALLGLGRLGWRAARRRRI
jgi:hypothetical protein